MQTPQPPQPNLCGPFDRQFKRKFRGHLQRAISVDRLKLLKVPSLKHALTKKAEEATNILPKIKQIEKIAKSSRKMGKAVNQYVDGVSDLELYIAKKLMNPPSTQLITLQIEQQIHKAHQERKIVNDNYLRMTAPNLRSPSPINPENSQSQNMNRTDYSPKKWLTDKELMQKFSQLTGKPEEETSSKDTNFFQPPGSHDSTVQEITSNKTAITQIAKKMIGEQNCYSLDQEDKLEEFRLQLSPPRPRVPGSSHNIDWIIEQCGEYQRQYLIRSRSLRGLPRK